MNRGALQQWTIIVFDRRMLSTNPVLFAGEVDGQGAGSDTREGDYERQATYHVRDAVCPSRETHDLARNSLPRNLRLRPSQSIHSVSRRDVIDVTSSLTGRCGYAAVVRRSLYLEAIRGETNNTSLYKYIYWNTLKPTDRLHTTYIHTIKLYVHDNYVTVCNTAIL